VEYQRADVRPGIPQRGETGLGLSEVRENAARELIKFGKNPTTWEEDEVLIVESRNYS